MSDSLPGFADTVVIGGGSAGAAIAGQLAVNRDGSLLLVEARPDYGSFAGGGYRKRCVEYYSARCAISRASRAIELSLKALHMESGPFESVANANVLYLTTIGRTTGLPREIEIWFVVCRQRFYLFAEHGEGAGWVKNIRRNSGVSVRIGELQINATARVLDRHFDREQWDEVAAMADCKYGWGDGLPVEIKPMT